MLDVKSSDYKSFTSSLNQRVKRLKHLEFGSHSRQWLDQKKISPMLKSSISKDSSYLQYFLSCPFFFFFNIFKIIRLFYHSLPLKTIFPTNNILSSTSKISLSTASNSSFTALNQRPDIQQDAKGLLLIYTVEISSHHITW